jgi:shikimate kinase
MDVVEMDEMIAKKNNMSISEIFDLHGEAYFRNEETNLLKEVGNEKNKIVSCGGGVAMREVNVQEMRKSGKVILLTAKPETILERVKENHDRPLLENNKTVEYVSELMEKRRPAYEAAADIVIATDGKSANEICEEIIAQVKKFK